MNLTDWQKQLKDAVERKGLAEDDYNAKARDRGEYHPTMLELKKRINEMGVTISTLERRIKAGGQASG